MPKFILCQGIGFSPGSVKYIPTLGFTSSGIIPPTPGTTIDRVMIGLANLTSRDTIIGGFN